MRLSSMEIRIKSTTQCSEETRLLTTNRVTKRPVGNHFSIGSQGGKARNQCIHKDSTAS